MTLGVIEGHSPIASIAKWDLCTPRWVLRGASRGSLCHRRVSCLLQFTATIIVFSHQLCDYYRRQGRSCWPICCWKIWRKLLRRETLALSSLRQLCTTPDAASAQEVRPFTQPLLSVSTVVVCVQLVSLVM